MAAVPLLLYCMLPGPEGLSQYKRTFGDYASSFELVEHELGGQQQLGGLTATARLFAAGIATSFCAEV